MKTIIRMCPIYDKSISDLIVYIPIEFTVQDEQIYHTNDSDKYKLNREENICK